MNNSKGFTLIELVIVIVILGILAATAAPKFIDLTGDARAAVISGVEGSVNSAADIAHAKALIEGATGEASSGDTIKDSITIGSTVIALNYGWPTNESIELMVEISDEDITFAANGPNGATWTHAGATLATKCIVEYNASDIADTETRPTVTSVTEDDTDPDNIAPGC